MNRVEVVNLIKTGKPYAGFATVAGGLVLLNAAEDIKLKAVGSAIVTTEIFRPIIEPTVRRVGSRIASIVART